MQFLKNILRDVKITCHLIPASMWEIFVSKALLLIWIDTLTIDVELILEILYVFDYELTAI